MKKVKVQSSWFKVQGLWFKVQGSAFRVQGSKFSVQSSRFQKEGEDGGCMVVSGDTPGSGKETDYPPI
jgi:hypothetical protein